MVHNIVKGTGYWRDGDEEIFQVGKDWVIWNWVDQCGHYFDGKRDMLRFIKAVK